MVFRRKLKRYLIAAVMLVLAAYAAVFIKDSVDSKNPEINLPVISVSTGFNPPYVVRAGYTWKFGFKTIYSPFVSPMDVPLMITDVPPKENIVITFTALEELCELFVAEGLGNEDFQKVYTWETPEKEGIYVYRIHAQFENGEIQYYFALQVKNQNIQP